MTIRAKYAGTCRKCRLPITAGSEINWSRDSGATHLECPKQQPVPSDAIHIGGGQGYGYQEYKPGQVVQNSARRIAEGQPEFLFVLRASKQYYSDEGMSFGVGDERGYVFSAACRPATDQESAPLRARIQLEAEIQAAKTRLRALADEIIAKRDQPRGPEGESLVLTQGERLLDTQNIYGGGDWWIVAEDAIWYIRNNGMDGDDWSCNNIRTGGAGAVGWKTIRTPELESELRQIAAKIQGGAR